MTPGQLTWPLTPKVSVRQNGSIRCADESNSQHRVVHALPATVPSQDPVSGTTGGRVTVSRSALFPFALPWPVPRAPSLHAEPVSRPVYARVWHDAGPRAMMVLGPRMQTSTREGGYVYVHYLWPKNRHQRIDDGAVVQATSASDNVTRASRFGHNSCKPAPPILWRGLLRMVPRSARVRT